ncbi:MAG TPA: GDP-mannose 4,6-dehydratase, partial [Devosia sp.]|nr:GDP-mannose 4,6-dehydratase [Devosia sp.]
MKILVTGAAGFIGFHVARRLLARGDAVVGLDNVNAYYDPALKQARLRLLADDRGHWEFRRADITDAIALDACFAGHRFDRVIHLAAQAGVRHSIDNPLAY